jgi:hypothetical protein
MAFPVTTIDWQAGRADQAVVLAYESGLITPGS